ncbi:MAG: hypothetical protein Rhims3KO_05850 [Hyphomicrobiales bacterium]
MVPSECYLIDGVSSIFGLLKAQIQSSRNAHFFTGVCDGKIGALSAFVSKTPVAFSANCFAIGYGAQEKIALVEQ